MNYGSRKINSRKTKHPGSQNIWGRLFDLVASIQVPHTWFTHYYVISFTSSIFWGFQILQHGKALQFLASFSRPVGASMTVSQILLAWTLMTAQGLRRLYESLTLAKPSHSKMWIGLWGLGMLYYLFIGIGIWIEGVRKYKSATLSFLRLIAIAALSRVGPLVEIQYSRPSAKTSVAIPMFVLASLAQNTCHEHLASLKKYSLPQHSMFRSIICPHYTCECLIYLAIAIISAPQGRFVNGTVMAGLVFVGSNLAVTADSTRKWYAEKFGEEAVGNRWRMVPFIF